MTTDAEYGALVKLARDKNISMHLPYIFGINLLDDLASAIEALIRERDEARKSADDMMAFWETVHKASEGRIAELEAGLRDLVSKLDQCTPHINHAFLFEANHGYHYQGPNWVNELASARALLPAEASDDR